jgi:hypothetical protein
LTQPQNKFIVLMALASLFYRLVSAAAAVDYVQRPPKLDVDVMQTSLGKRCPTLMDAVNRMFCVR